MNLSRVLMLVATLSLQEKPRVSLKKFVKIGRPGYKGKNAEDSHWIKSVDRLLTSRLPTVCSELL